MSTSSYVARERIELSIRGFQGRPQELTLELILPDESVSTFILGGAEIQGNELDGYTYQFVPTDAQRGLWRLRWFGKDVNGIEFTRPSDRDRSSVLVR